MPDLEGQRRVLLLTNSEYGQVNTFIALTYALAVLPNVHVHFGSFADCAARILKLRDTLTAHGTLGAGSAIIFHDIGGPSMKQASQFQVGTFVHPPGFFGAIKSYHVLSEKVLNWNGEQYMAGVDGCVRIINEVDPHAIAVDNLLNQGYDACIKLGHKHLATGPLSLKDICVLEQSRFILNYPVLRFLVRHRNHNLILWHTDYHLDIPSPFPGPKYSQTSPSKYTLYTISSFPHTSEKSTPPVKPPASRALSLSSGASEKILNTSSP